MDARKNRRQQTVAAHAHPNSRLTELEYKKDASNRKECTQGNDATEPGQMILENMGQWVGYVEFTIIDDASEQERNHHVKNRANGHRIEYSPRYVALRVFAFFRRGGNSVESDEGPEYRRHAFEHAG